MRIVAFVAFLVVAAFLLIVPASMRPFGEPRLWEMDHYFLEHAQEELAANNVCTAIVFDYRGYDTLGEATVLFTAVVAVAALLRRLKEGEA
ncbi:MAG: hydrogen gas-evolving membrane-bound hydrogenase subunit E [Candidatus Bipolaricaulia bacterium]